jgi:hypothetical protein
MGEWGVGSGAGQSLQTWDSNLSKKVSLSVAL